MSAPDWLTTYLSTHTAVQVGVHMTLVAGALLFCIGVFAYSARHR